MSTPPGRGALASVRVSGSDAVALVAPHFRGARSTLHDAPGYTLHPGAFLIQNDIVDHVVVGVFRAPHSYTGEDTVEITAHGNPAVVETILRACLAAGGRAAEPGEFTRRAFLNGKLDLAQAEAVAALISARSETAARVAMRQLDGALSRRVKNARQELVHALSLIEAVIDFPEQDLEPLDRDAVSKRLHDAATTIDELIDACERGRQVAAQPTAVLVGVPNVGKSSLFNALLKRDRAIVHESPGTTRDSVDAELTLGGLSFRLVDTAGVVDTADSVEAEGVRRSRREVEQADAVIFVLDATRPRMNREERALFESFDPRRLLGVFNKCDLLDDVDSLPTMLITDDDRAADAFAVSAKSGAGVATLEQALRSRLECGEFDGADVVIAGEWQFDRLRSSRAAVAEAASLVSNDPVAEELVAEELRTGTDALGSLLGLRVGEEILDVIFGEFCIGK